MISKPSEEENADVEVREKQEDQERLDVADQPKKKVSIVKKPSVVQTPAEAVATAANAFIDDEELEDFVPHYQRVSITGDDNTGVSKTDQVLAHPSLGQIQKGREFLELCASRTFEI